MSQILQPPYTPPATSLIQNYVPGSLNRFKAAFAKSRAGISGCTIALGTDSTNMGASSDDTGGGSTLVNQRPNGPAVIMGRLMSAAGIPAEARNFFGMGTNASVNPTLNPGGVDSRITRSASTWVANTATSFGPSLGGFPFTAASGTDTLTFTVDGDFDTVVVWHGQNGAGANSMTMNVDGGATAATLSNGAGPASPVRTATTVPATGAGTHTINLTRVSGTPCLYGIEVYKAAETKVRFWAIGWGGYAITDWTNFVAANQYCYPAHVLTSVAPVIAKPDLLVINSQINDAFVTPTATGLITYQTGLQTLIDKCVTGGVDILFETGFPSQNSQTALTTQQQFRDAMIAKAVQNGIPYVDHWAQFVSWENSQARGLTGDSYHPNKAGYYVKEQNLLRALLAA